MPLRSIIRRRPLLGVLLISALVGLAAAKMNSAGDLQLGVATAHVLVDYPQPSLVQRRALDQDRATIQKRAEFYARLATTQPVLDAIARRAGIPADEISGVARLNQSVPGPLMQPDSELRASQIVASWAPYRLELQSEIDEPVLEIYAAAPSGDQAGRLANSAVLGLRDYLSTLARRQGYPQDQVPQLHQLGDARGTTVSHRAKYVIAVLTFITAFGLTALALLALRRLRAGPKRQAEPAISRGADNWPHTTRLLPWCVAGFLSMLWLMPFDRIQLSFHTPIDLKFDRLVLPLLIVVWLVAFAAGGRFKPRLRLTPIHVAVGAFVAVAFLSVTLDARYLNQTMELMLSLKKLPLLLAYVSLFVIVSTAIRPTEVRSFMTLTLGLAVIVGLGLIVQYRTNTNVFNVLADKLLPSPFELVGGVDAGGGVDSLGRRAIIGPTSAGLETVGILALALPIAVVRLLSATRRNPRILYAAAICILTAGMFATSRKSGLIAPAAVMLTLGYFRRRELLSLAPMGLVIAFAVSLASPGAIHGIISQFVRPNSTSVATTSDRVADYDAIRPDVWSHLVLGRGFGSYDHETYRVLDSEILSRTVETGVVGLLAFLAIGISVILASRRTIGQRRSPYSALALIGAAAAVDFLVMSALFDELSFPHMTYLFLSMAALVSVVIGREQASDPGRPGHRARTHVTSRPPAPAHASPRREPTLV